MTDPIIIDLPMPPDCLHPNARVHWAKKAKATKEARSVACMVARQYKPKVPIRKPQISLDFYLKRTRDLDGLVAFIKAYFDGLQDAKIYENDSSVEFGHVRRHKVKERPAKVPGVVFTIVEAN